MGLQCFTQFFHDDKRVLNALRFRLLIFFIYNEFPAVIHFRKEIVALRISSCLYFVQFGEYAKFRGIHFVFIRDLNDKFSMIPLYISHLMESAEGPTCEEFLDNIS